MDKTVNLRNNLFATKKRTKGENIINIDELLGNIKELKKMTGSTQQYIIARLCMDGLRYGPFFAEEAIALGVRKPEE